jgi:dihydroorotase
MKKILIKGGTVIDPISQKAQKRDLLVKDGIYIDPIKSDTSTEIIEANGHYIMPGLFDLRCHLNQPGVSFQDSVDLISRKASAGGFTSILAMPKLSSMADNPETLKYTKESIINENHINIYLSGCLTLGTEGKSLAPMGSLKETGIIAVTDCPNCTQNNQIYSKAAEYASMFDLPIVELPRDYSLSPEASAHESLLSLKMGLQAFPRIAEELFVARSILISKYCETQIHLSSITSKGSIELIKEAKEAGVRITSDTTANHLYCTEKQIEDFDPLSKPLPPFRESEDQVALIDAVNEGVIDAISTGHQSYSFDDKSKEFDIAPPGTMGLENAFLQFYSKLGISIEERLILISRLMSKKPAQILNLESNSFEKNQLANFFIFNPEGETIIERTTNERGGVNFPYKRKKFKGEILKTVARGKLIFEK